MDGDQVRRYARHILLPEVGGVGQSALLAATARIDVADDPAAAGIAAEFIAAGGTGALELVGELAAATRTRLATVGPDCVIRDAAGDPGGRPLALAPVGAWFPSAPGDDLARALWRGSLAAVQWMADTVADAAPAPIAVPPSLLAAIYAHARAAFPAECCGYLVGGARGAAVDAVIPCANVAVDAALAPGRDAATAFAIGGAELLAFARSFGTARPARIVYHSHTNGRAYFSALDRAVAGEPPAYPVQHVVVGVTATGVTEGVQLAWSSTARALVEIARWQVP